jgi:hypothetical protein
MSLSKLILIQNTTITPPLTSEGNTPNDNSLRGTDFAQEMFVHDLSNLFLYLQTYASEPGSSVSIASRYALDDWAIEVRFLAEPKGIFL